MLRVIENSVIKDRVNCLRDINLPRETLRNVVADLGFLLLYEALKDSELSEREIQTWRGRKSFEFISEGMILVPVLRAGVAMLEGAKDLLPDSRVGFLMATRNEETLEVEVNCEKIPDLRGSRVFILDPMLATGNTLLCVLEALKKKGAEKTDSLHILATEEGIRKVEERFPDHSLWVAVIDPELSSSGFILPGLGDMGDRLYS